MVGYYARIKSSRKVIGEDMNLARNYFAIPPGQSIFETMILENKSHEEMALQLGLSEEALTQLLDGILVIDESLANVLASVIGKSSAYWLQQEQQYRRRILLKDGIQQFKDEDYNIQLEW